MQCTTGWQEPQLHAVPLPVCLPCLDTQARPALGITTSCCLCRCLSAVWHPRSLARWRHWSAPPPSSADSAAWRDTYKRRHKVDSHTLQLLVGDVTWPNKKSNALTTIMAYGSDALDVLTAAAQASTHSGLYIGITHHAQIALQLVQGQLAAERIEQVLAAESGNAPAGSYAAAAAVGSTSSTAAAPGGTVAPAGPLADDSGLAEALQASVDLTKEQPASRERDHVLEVALQVAQAIHPLSDMGTVRSIITQLGDELQKRMAAAGAAPGSRQALELLNTLLFSKPQAPDTTSSNASASGQQADIPSTSTNSSTSVSSQGIGHGPAGCWSSVWPCTADSFRADLSAVQVPNDGQSGLGIKGTTEAYGRASSSCIDSVIARRTGLPITLAVLHRAVGRHAGLDIELVNMPGHIINRVYLDSTASAASAGSSSGRGTAVAYVDAFGGKEWTDDELSDFITSLPWLLHNSLLPLPPEPQRQQLLPDMSARAVSHRMLANLCNLCRSATSLHWLAGGEVGCLQLSTALVQLGARFAADAFRHAFHAVSREGLGCWSWLAGLYLQLLQDEKLRGVLLPGPMHQFQVLIEHEFHCLPEPEDNADVWAVKGLQVQVGACSQVPIHSAHHRTHTETKWTVWRNMKQGEDICALGVLSSKELGCHGQMVHTIPDRVAPTDPHAEASSSSPPWTNSSCSQTIQQAVQILQHAWFEDNCTDTLSRFLQSSGQQLPTADSWEGLADMAKCGQGLGQWFDAVWYDQGLGRCVLVPSSYMRHRFPHG